MLNKIKGWFSRDYRITVSKEDVTVLTEEVKVEREKEQIERRRIAEAEREEKRRIAQEQMDEIKDYLSVGDEFDYLGMNCLVVCVGLALNWGEIYPYINVEYFCPVNGVVVKEYYYKDLDLIKVLISK